MGPYATAPRASFCRSRQRRQTAKEKYESPYGTRCARDGCAFRLGSLLDLKLRPRAE